MDTIRRLKPVLLNHLICAIVPGRKHSYQYLIKYLAIKINETQKDNFKMNENTKKSQKPFIDKITSFPFHVKEIMIYLIDNAEQLDTDQIKQKVQYNIDRYRFDKASQIKSIRPETIWNINKSKLDDVCNGYIKNAEKQMNNTSMAILLKGYIKTYCVQSRVCVIFGFEDTIFPSAECETIDKQNLNSWLIHHKLGEYFNNFTNHDIISLEDVKRNIKNTQHLKSIKIKASKQQIVLDAINGIITNDNGYVDGNQFEFNYINYNADDITNEFGLLLRRLNETYLCPNLMIISNKSKSYMASIINKFGTLKTLLTDYNVRYGSANDMFHDLYPDNKCQWKQEYIKMICDKDNANMNLYISISSDIEQYLAMTEIAKERQYKSSTLFPIILKDKPSSTDVEIQLNEVRALFSDEIDTTVLIHPFYIILPSEYHAIKENIINNDSNESIWSQELFPKQMKHNAKQQQLLLTYKIRKGSYVYYKESIYYVIHQKGSKVWLKNDTIDNYEYIENVFSIEYIELFKILKCDEAFAKWLASLDKSCVLCAAKFENKRNLISHNSDRHDAIYVTPLHSCDNPGILKRVKTIMILSDAINYIDDYYNRYEQLGEPGTFGSVQRCTKKTTPRTNYAVKTMNKSMIYDDEKQQRVQNMRNEIEIMEILNHPNICKLLDVVEDRNYIHLVMEYIKGKNLGDVIIENDANDGLNENVSCDIMRQILSALVEMQKWNVAHFDLSTNNIILVHNAPNSRIKIIDFGESRIVKRGETLNGKIGTPYFISPEMLNDDEYDPFCCDIWSIGVIGFCMLFGYPPFHGDDHDVIYGRIEEGFEPKIEDGYGAYFARNIVVEKDISVEALNFISKTLVKNPNKRMTLAQSLKHPWITGMPNIEILC